MRDCSHARVQTKVILVRCEMDDVVQLLSLGKLMKQSVCAAYFAKYALAR